MTFEKNLNDYLSDISAQKPVGEDLKYDPVYDKIQEYLREDLDLPQGVWVQDLKVADWKGGETLCLDVLQKQTKDLQIAAWLTEIWMSIYRMEGLDKGLNLVLQLSEKYWDTIYPLPQNGDMEFRMAPFLWLNEKLSERTHRIIVTAPNDTVGNKTFAAYLAVKDYLHEKTLPTGEIGQRITEFQTSLAKTPSAFLIQLHKDTQSTIATTQRLEAFLDTKFGKEAPTLYHMRQDLEEFSQYCQQMLLVRGESLTEKKEETMVATAQTQDPSKPAATEGTGGPIKSRDDAYRVIQEAADYLYAIEPHSPTPFLIRKAISWGHLSFEELMNEVVHDQASVADMRRLLGIISPLDNNLHGL